ncbi:MAG: TIGR04282 family arsenosugar biosynthesis glycosyltransferase [Salibacteraceae bacterium]
MSTPTLTNLLLIFAKNPDLGKAKTRLAKTVGDEAALRVYKALLAHTQGITQEVKVDKAVFYADRLGPENDGWRTDAFMREVQSGADLGVRMSTAFSWGFVQGYKRIVIIGTDCYELDAQGLENAFEALMDHDAVIGPAKDGGYYLLGLSDMLPSLFQDKNWSTDEVLPATLSDLEKGNAKVKLLTTLSDVDTEADLPEPLRQLL